MVVEGYYRWKAMLWVVGCLLFAVVMIWFANELSDPSWQADGSRGGVLESIPVWVRVSVFGAFGVLMAMLSIYLAVGVFVGWRVFRVDGEGVTVFDPIVQRETSVKWTEITSLNDVHGTIVIHVPKAIRKSRRVATTIPNFTNAKKKDVLAAISHYRPDLLS